ncbi:MAG: PQQ-binding-like beta-propeller repeat protein, partial [Sandarakinorhabdus sp.]|nr:PQQ-binding-like beta-propeller repeat protein [Sandarakinorhabdus sp.]
MKIIATLPLSVTAALMLTTAAVAQTPAKEGTVAARTTNGVANWTTYNADLKGSRYSPLDQINAGNFNNLEIAWRLKTDFLGSRPEYKLESTPLAVDGVIYTTAGTRRSVVALNGATGELLWTYALHEGLRSAESPRALSGRGLSYWTDGTKRRILYVTIGYRLISLDADTGRPDPDFGENGMVDLKKDFDQDLGNLDTGEVGVHSAPAVSGNTIIIGAAFREGFTPKTHNNTKGYVRAFDVRTGKRIWTFHTIPKKGEFGYDTWLKESADINGNTGVWTQVSVDEDLGLAYLAVESATSDFYGGKRPGNNLFANSLVAVDLKTG